MLILYLNSVKWIKLNFTWSTGIVQTEIGISIKNCIWWTQTQFIQVIAEFGFTFFASITGRIPGFLFNKYNTYNIFIFGIFNIYRKI